jgi:hypothetical protein
VVSDIPLELTVEWLSIDICLDIERFSRSFSLREFPVLCNPLGFPRQLTNGASGPGIIAQ